MIVRDGLGATTRVAVATAPAHHYILGLDFQKDDLWVATAHGLKPRNPNYPKESRQ